MILAIDLGSTNFKAALFDSDLNRMGECSLPSPYLCNDGNCVEMDAGEVRQTIVKLIKNICRDANVGTDSISSARAAYIADVLKLSQKSLTTNPQYFTGLLPASQHWRIFPHFR